MLVAVGGKLVVAPTGAASSQSFARAPRPRMAFEVQARIYRLFWRGQDVLRTPAEPLWLLRGRWVPRPYRDKARAAAVSEFQSGAQPIVVVTAGSPGRSLHAARDGGTRRSARTSSARCRGLPTC